MPKIKVLLLLHELTWTGSPRIVLEAFRAMGDAVDVRMIAEFGGSYRAEFERLGPLLVLHDRWAATRLRAWAFRRHLKGFLEGLRRWSPEVIYVNSVGSIEIKAALDLPDAPAILHVHELGFGTGIIMASQPDLLTRWPRRYIGVSRAVVEHLEEGCGIDGDRVAMIHEFTTPANFDGLAPSPSRPEGAPLVVGGSGAPSWRKGVLLWLQMAVELRRILGSGVRFIWVGMPESGHESYAVRARLKLLGLEGAVELVPPTSKPFEEYAKFDIFAMTSWEDPCPLVVLENMMLGKPVAYFTGSGGAAEEAGESGIAVADFDPREMARAIASLAADPAELARRGALARARILENFTDRVQIPKILREIEAVARGEAVAIRPERVGASSP